MYKMIYWTLRNFMCASLVVRCRWMIVSFVVVVGLSRRVCVEVVYSCHKHALHQIDTYVWFDGVMYLIWGMFAFYGLSHYFDQGSSACFPCALTVKNIICVLFLLQCFLLLSPSTETSISGTSPKLPLCEVVSQYVY